MNALLDEVILLNDPADRDCHDRGLVLTRPVVEDLWESAVEATLGKGSSRETLVYCPEVPRADDLENGPEYLAGSTQMLHGDRAPRRRRTDVRHAFWTELNPDAWFLTVDPPHAEPEHLYWMWDVMAASLVLGPVEAMRAHFRQMSTHPRFAAAMLFPPESPRAFSDVLDEPDRWPELLTSEELAILLTSDIRKVREAAIATLGASRSRIRGR